jgi:NAD-dependent deacetylase
LFLLNLIANNYWKPKSIKMEKIVVLSGAGISQESGIATFRDSDGLWEQYAIEEVATPQAWKKNPDLVTEFYNLRRKQLLEVEPNAAHFYFAELEKKYEVYIVTQNIDDLHERAGSKHVLHLHGELKLAKSSGPNQEKKYYPIEGWELTKEDLCDEGFRLRPHVVWFGEEVPAMSEAVDLVRAADYVVVIGTSLNVYPAAGLIDLVAQTTKCFLIDPNADSFSKINNVELINKTAVEGIKDLPF